MQGLIVELNLGPSWKLEMAALLSQLGCVTISPKIIEMARRGDPLSSSQQKAIDRHPVIGSDLLKKIPRLEEIAWMVSQQHTRPDSSVAEFPAELSARCGGPPRCGRI